MRRLIETLGAQAWPTCRSPASAPPRPTRTAETLEAFFKEARLQREERTAAAPRDARGSANGVPTTLTP